MHTPTKEQIDLIREEVVAELHYFVDANTRPRSKAAAAFTKRQAADLKAGMSDGAAGVARRVVAFLETGHT